MPDYRIRVGMLFIWRGREYVIDGRLSGGAIKVRDTATDQSFAKPAAELVEELFAGRLEFIGEGGSRRALKEKLVKTGVTDISHLDDDDPVKVELNRRHSYVKELISARTVTRTGKNLIPLISRVSQKIGDPRPPSWVTLNRWFRVYESSGRDVRALASSYKARGNRKPKSSGTVPSELTEDDYEKARQVSAMVDRVIRTKYLTLERPSVTSIHKTLVGRVIEENRHRDTDNRLPIPHVSSLYKVINGLDRYEVDRARHGKKYADEKHRAIGLGPRPSRPLERVECDHTKTDLMVVDTKTLLPLGRPWLTAIIDVYTKMILGIYLGFHRPGTLSAMQCLLHAVRPKSYVKAEYPSVEHDWPAYGIPELVVVDNAREFHGSSFKDACRQLGIEVEYSPPGSPWFRGTGERWFGTLNRRLLHELPGTTFSNIFAKKDYDPQKHAVISLQALLEILHVWIVDVYHQSVHRGIRDVPHRRWTQSIVNDPPNLPASSEELQILLGFVEQRSVSRSGVELFTLLYNSSALSLVRRRLGEGEKVTLKYDPTDISVIYVRDPHERRYIPVPALDQEYTRKLTIWQHHVIRRYARRLVHDHVDIVALCRAKQCIQEIVERERLLKGGTGGMQQIAHYLNLGQPKYEEGLKQVQRAAQEDRPRQITRAGQASEGYSEVQADIQEPKGFSSSTDTQATGLPSGIVNETGQNWIVSDDGWEADYDLPVEES